MTITAIDLNDCELRVARDGIVVTGSPGFAAFDKGQVTVGAAALAYAQAHPRGAENRFWRDLGTAPLADFGRRVRHHGDLAYLHLEHLRALAGDLGDAVLLVPGSLQHEQLALLLGIARAARIDVRAVVDSAVAAGASALAPGSYAHVDLQLHQAVITRLDVGERVVRHAVEVVPGLGALRFEQICARVVTDAFVAHCRFDPLHHAASEQMLYQQLPAWLRALQNAPEIEARIDYRGTRFAVRLPREGLWQAAEPLLQTLLNRVAPGITPVASYRLAEIPGFRAGHRDVAALGATAAFEALGPLRSVERATHGLRLTLDLPASTRPGVQPAPFHETGADRATHLLAGHRACALREAPLRLSPRGTCGYGEDSEALCSVRLRGGRAEATAIPGGRVLLNGRPLSGTRPLAAGDQLSFVGAPVLFLAITVAPADDV